MMAAQPLPINRSLTPTFQNSSTPGSIFLNRKPSFRPTGKETFHYKFDTLSAQNGFNNAPINRRSTVNVTFNPAKNNMDPYVHASNWLPKFKDHCKGFLARHHAEELRKKHEAARTIQRAASYNLDPWVQIFRAIQPTFKVVKIDELKKYLRECIIQIKKLNSERHFVEGQLSEVEDMMEQAYQINDNPCLSIEGQRSPNIFAKLSEVQSNANNDTFLKECLDLDIDGITNVEVCFDPSTFQNSKVNSVYELADKLKQKIHEDRHRWQSLQDKCNHYEKEAVEMRNTNAALDTTTKMLRGIIAKNDINLQEQKDKVQDYVTLLEKVNQEKKSLSTKIKEQDRSLMTKQEELVQLNSKCEYLDDELEKKTKTLETLNQEKVRNDKKVKELEEKLNYNLENQTELESTIEIQKHRLTELKKRLSEQLKTTEEELMQTIADQKAQLQEQSELLESHAEKMKQYEIMIRRLEHKIDEERQKDSSDIEIDFERERQLGQQLKHSNANMETMREEMKLMESNCEELQKRVQELQKNLDKANEETMEHKKSVERLKVEIQGTKSALTDTELKLSRANRERNFNHQKWNQAKEKSIELEHELVRCQDELTHNALTITTKNKEIESIDQKLTETKKNFESKVRELEATIHELNNKINEYSTLSAQKADEWKKAQNNYENKIEEMAQSLEEKEIEIEQYQLSEADSQKSLKKLQRRIAEQEELQTETQKTIMKLKDQINSLQEENDSQWNTMPSSGLSSPLDQRDRTFPRSTGSITPQSPSSNEGYFTLPIRASTRK